MLATKTKEAIEAAIMRDGGNAFRHFLGEWLPKMDDAYRQDTDDGRRTHLGASLIGRPCGRQLWYSFRWAQRVEFSGRMLRLFNRGHCEEARFIAMLLAIGCKVWQQTPDGKQFRISGVGGHYGGSLDGVVLGIPDMPNEPLLTEFKTHNDKSFQKLVKEGVRSAKYEHYVQMQQYGHKYGLRHALYMAVNKNDDDLYLEIVEIEPAVAERYTQRAQAIIEARHAPQRVGNGQPGWFQCRFCDAKDLCHSVGTVADRNCRTCEFSVPLTDREGGVWECSKHGVLIDKERQKMACDFYAVHHDLK